METTHVNVTDSNFRRQQYATEPSKIFFRSAKLLRTQIVM